MKTFQLMALLIASVLGGLALFFILTMVAWNTQIEPKGFQCTDSIWPLDNYWTDMDTHRGAGDTLSPGWTWDDLEVIRKYYIAAFYTLWVVGAVVPFWAVIRILKKVQMTTPPDASLSALRAHEDERK